MITLALILVWLGYSALLYMAVFWLLVFLEKNKGYWPALPPIATGAIIATLIGTYF